MEDLINLREYAEQNGTSWFICKQWIDNGLKTVGKRPYKTKKIWIDKFLEDYEENKPQRITSKHQLRAKSKCNSKIDINKFL